MNLLSAIGVSPQEYWAKWHEFSELSEFAGLTPFDRHLLWRELTQGEFFKEWPVPIGHFVTDPYYIGTDLLVRPKIKEFLSDFWAPEAPFQLWAFVGGLGSGKSFSASISLAYALYQLSCMVKPQTYLNRFEGISLSGDAEIVMMNASAAGHRQAAKVVYGEVYEKVEKSPYFVQHFPAYPGKATELEFPNRIRLAPGTSHWQSALGWNLWGFVIDEAAFGIESERADYVKELFSNLNKRRVSRFKRLGFGGLFTSPGSEYAYVELIAQEGSSWDVSTMVRRIATWEAAEELVPGARVFLLERHEPIRVLEEYRELIYRGIDNEGYGIAERPTGEKIRWKVLTAAERKELDEEERSAVPAAV